MRRLLVPLFIIILSGGAWAQDTKPDKPDARLDQKVTLEVSHTKLEDVCKLLTEKTGVTIKAGSGERDWKVRERKVTIQAKDVKLDTLMKEISKLLGFYLSKSGKEGEWAYLYWQDKKSRDLETEMLSAEREAAAQKLTEKRQATLDAAQKALKMTPEEIEKAKKEDPFTAYLAGTKSGRGFAELLSGLAGQFPTERDLMLRGKRVTLPISDLPGNLQQAIMDTTAGGIVAAEEKKNGKDFPGDMSPQQLVFMPIDQTMEYEAGVLGLSGAVIVNGIRPGDDPSGGPFGWGDPMSLFILTQPDSPVGKLIGQAFQAVDDGEDPDEVGKRMNEKASDKAFLASSLVQESPTEKYPPTDPRLTREIEITEDVPAMSFSDKSSGTQMAKSVAVISEAIGMPVLLESFTRLVPPGGYIQKGKQPLYRLLVAFEKADYTWELSEDTLRVRPRDWALRRSYEIPESFITRYRGILEKQGEFSLDDVATIATELTDEQISNTLMADPEFSDILGITMMNDTGSTKSILRLYHSLTLQQRSAMTSETGLPFAELTGEQWSVMSEIIMEKLGGAYVQDGSLLHKPIPPDDKSAMAQDNFEISVLIADQKEPSVVKERVLRWRKSHVESMKENRRKAEEQRKAAEEQPKTEPAK